MALDRWIGLRVKTESTAIDTVTHLIKVPFCAYVPCAPLPTISIQTTIEAGTPLYYQLRLYDENVFVDKELLVRPLPSLVGLLWHPAGFDS